MGGRDLRANDSVFDEQHQSVHVIFHPNRIRAVGHVKGALSIVGEGTCVETGPVRRSRRPETLKQLIALDGSPELKLVDAVLFSGLPERYFSCAQLSPTANCWLTGAHFVYIY